MADKVDDETIARVMRELGRRGGKAEVPKGFSTLTPAKRRAIAKAAAKKRWANKQEASKK